MKLKEYHERSQARAIYPNRGNNIVYPILGLCGESGEAAEKVKKVLRDRDGNFSEEDRRLIIKELGDILWYISAAAAELGTDLEEVALVNLEKVDGRHARNTLHGSGDDR